MNTSNAIVSVNGLSSNTKKRAKKELWTLPVSKKFYERFFDKVRGVLDDMRAPWIIDDLRRMIDNYLADREVPVGIDFRYVPFVIFMSLRPEIDAAIERSAAARLRAAARRAAKAAVLEVPASTEAEMPVQGI